MANTRLTYIGIDAPEDAKARIAVDAYRHLGMSKIPDRHGKGLDMTISMSDKCAECREKCDSVIYNARVSLDGEEAERSPMDALNRFAGALYFPIPAGESYKRVIYEGMKKLDDLWGAVGLGIEISKDGIGSMELHASDAWAIMAESDPVVAVKDCTRKLVRRAISGISAKLVVDLGEKEGNLVLDIFKSYLNMYRDVDIDAGITLAAGDDAVKRRYNEELKKIGASAISDSQTLVLMEALQNLENYDFYLRA